MASVYPGALDNFSTTRTDDTQMATNHPNDHDNANDALNKIEAELGVNPKGNFATVNARLAKPDVEVFSHPGTLDVGAGSGRFVFPFAATISEVRMVVGTAPSGASLICDVNKNGTTIFTTQANRPTISSNQTTSPAATPAVTAVAAGDVLSVDIDQVGSTVPGSDLTVVISYTR